MAYWSLFNRRCANLYSRWHNYAGVYADDAKTYALTYVLLIQKLPLTKYVGSFDVFHGNINSRFVVMADWFILPSNVCYLRPCYHWLWRKNVCRLDHGRL